MQVIGLFLLTFWQTKAATASCSVTKMFRCVSLPGGILDRTTSAKKKRSSAESRGTLAKTCVLLELCLFAWDIEVLWIFLEETNLEHPYKIRYSVKGIHILLGGFPLYHSWENDENIFYPEQSQLFIYNGLKNRDALLNSWHLEGAPVLNLFLALEHLSSWETEADLYYLR